MSSVPVRAAWVVVAAGLLAACAGPREEVDWLLFGGRVLTLDDRGSVHSAIALHDGSIVDVGDDLRSRYRGLEEVDLAGRAVLPGFVASLRDLFRHGITSIVQASSEETMAAMAAHEIAVTQQPNFTYTLEGRYVANLDGERLEHNNPMRSPMDHGVHLALSSDILPIGPAVGLYAAVTRRGMSGRVFGESEKLTVDEALRAYTRGGAFLTFEEHRKGSLEVGKAADLVILANDPLAIDPLELLELRVDATFLAGRRVYSSDDTE